MQTNTYNKDVLKNSFDSGYADSDIDIIINEAIDYLSKPGATKRGLEDILGLSNKQPNLTEIKSKFNFFWINFLIRRKTIEKVLGKKINVAVPKQNITDELIDEVYRFTQANIDGFSLDLGNPESWGKEAMLYVSPYKTRQLVLTGKDSLTKELNSKKEEINLRLDVLQKQEDTIKEKAEKLRNEAMDDMNKE